LKSLCSLVGPYGVKLIDREVLKFILSNVNGIKEYLSHNKQALEDLSKNYYNEPACNESLRKLKDVDGFILKSIAIGNALNFRALLREALRQVVEERVPFIYNTVQTGFREYRTNTFMANDLLPLDCLALDCGLDVGTADQALKKFLSKAIGAADQPLWDLLPLMYAASFTSTVWKDAQFKAVIEGHLNNAHTLARCINDLIVTFRSTTTTSVDEKEIINLLRIFVEVSSVIILRMARAPAKQDKHGPIDYPSIVIFMDLFVEHSPLLTRDIIENCIPYSLLRNEWKSIYSRTGKAATPKGEDVF